MTLLASLCLLIGFAFALPMGIGLYSSGLWRIAQSWRYVLLALLVALVYFSVIYFPVATLAVFKHSTINWSGKLVAIAALFAVYTLLPRPLKTETGLLRLAHPPEWSSTLAVSGVAVMFFVFCNSLLSMINNHICRHPSLETISFAATLPGLDEELVFRGLLLAILVAAFGKPWRVLGVSVGWGAVAVICLFGVAHGYETASQGAPWLLACLIALISGMMGAMLLWIKERTASIWLGVLVHNLANLAAALICS
jgi:membrane protease YdiL (CAAX protease family)